LREAAGIAVADGGRTIVQSARDHGVSWPVVATAFTAYAATVFPDQPDPVAVLGIDETRRGDGAHPLQAFADEIVLGLSVRLNFGGTHESSSWTDAPGRWCQLVPLEIRIRVLICGFARGLRGVFVLVDQPCQDGFAADTTVGDVREGWWIGVQIWWSLCPGLVRPMAVVVHSVLIKHVRKMGLVDHQQPVEQFAAQGAHHPLADRVRPRSPWRTEDDPDAPRRRTRHRTPRR
jgi:hypothetical protein